MAETSTPGLAPRWMRIALSLSLALNLLVVGIVLGAITMHGRHDRERRIARDVAAAPFVMALDDADRRAVIDELRSETGSLRENRRLIRARFGALLEALRAETFDRGMIETLLAEQRGAATVRQEVGERIFLDRLERMSAAERGAFADRLEKSIRKHPPH
jgi:uncharacterized membrane protein